MSEQQGMGPGWYYASGDAEGTRRYWDGSSWVGEPQVWQAPTTAPSAPGSVDQYQSKNLGIASAGQRIGGSLLDALVQLVLFGIPAMIAIFAVLDLSSFDQLDLESTGGAIGMQDLGVSRTSELLITYVPTLVGFLWQFLWDGLKGGTPGKLMVGTRIVNDGQPGPLGFTSSFKRNLVYLGGLIPLVGGLITGVLWFISFIFLFSDDKRQTIMDKFAGTVVVEKEFA